MDPPADIQFALDDEALLILDLEPIDDDNIGELLEEMVDGGGEGGADAGDEEETGNENDRSDDDESD
ncbi:hypothetical protein GCK72_011498 [Caenorhabditis remanei]|uniref:Uncharacterized protein n=1 Tax=Caenorhabditis remanei TaxID=31234 RepID=A0A6A5HA08_CAERE|nr:hypothetical protein GCK72_011498 [Caenorhabditis remanei]KAF1763232.1 hypothetical protein GCK72_011498 [Caenorhabditis remanei]